MLLITRFLMLLSFAAAFLSTSIVEARVWTNRSGKTIEADFVRLEGANVVVSRQGKEISIPLETLSDEDQSYAKTATPPAKGGTDVDPFAADGKSSGGSSKPTTGDDDEKEGSRSGKYPLREWRDRLGNRSKARFVAVAGQDVIIEKANGQRTNVPFHTLVENDQEYVERELKKAGTAHLTPSRAPPQNGLGVGGGGAQPPPGGYGPGMGLGPPSFDGPPSTPPPSGGPPGYSTPPGGIGPGYGPPTSPSGPPGGFGSKPGPPGGYSTPPSGPGSSSTEPGFGAPPGGYSSPPSGAPPGGYSSPPSGAPPGGFGPPGDPSSPPTSPFVGSGPPAGPPPGGYAPPGGYSGPPTGPPSSPNFGPPSGAPFGAPYGTPGGPGFNGPIYKETYFCTKCNKQLPDSVKAGDRCPHCRAYLAYEQGADGKKKFASGGSLATYFIFGGGGFTAIAVIIGVVIRVIISAVKD